MNHQQECITKCLPIKLVKYLCRTPFLLPPIFCTFNALPNDITVACKRCYYLSDCHVACTWLWKSSAASPIWRKSSLQHSMTGTHFRIKEGIRWRKYIILSIFIQHFVTGTHFRIKDGNKVKKIHHFEQIVLLFMYFLKLAT